MTQRNKQRALRYVREVITADNVDAIEEIFAPLDEVDFKTRVGTEPDTYEEMKQYFTRMLGAQEDLSVTVDTVVAEGDEVMVRYEMTGRITDEVVGVPATAHSFETAVVSHFRFDDGRIVEAHDHVNEMDVMPEVVKVARHGIVNEMRDGIVVVDDDHHIIDLNPAARDIFARDRDALLGDPVDVLLGGDTTPPAPGESVVITGGSDRRYFEVEASPLTNQDGERIGRTLVLREITERRRHVQQLEVLNRVLRHNLRNDLAAVQGTLEAAQERTDDDVSQLLASARATTEQLVETAETARAVQTALEDTAVERQSLGTILPSVVERAREQYPAATIDLTVEEPPSVEAVTALDDALWELLANACEHAGAAPHVEVAAGQQDETVDVTITDDGPGIPAHEWEVLEAGEETDLQHGSGLGLWLAHWVLEASGGKLTFAVDDGTTARATLPSPSLSE